MQLAATILKNYSRDHALKVAAYACRSGKNFAELMACYMSEDYRLSQRAAWSVGWAARKNRR